MVLLPDLVLSELDDFLRDFAETSPSLLLVVLEDSLGNYVVSHLVPHLCVHFLLVFGDLQTLRQIRSPQVHRLDDLFAQFLIRLQFYVCVLVVSAEITEVLETVGLG